MPQPNITNPLLFGFWNEKEEENDLKVNNFKTAGRGQHDSY